jgi:hypothetical protein
MGKRTSKLLVYLDQNFLSDIAKADTSTKVRPEFAKIYELLRRGVNDEKLVVPGSVLHDIESSLATHLKDRIVSCQHRLGKVRLYRPDEIRDKQIAAALGSFMGQPAEDPLRPRAAFIDDPDQRVARYGISVDSHLETRNFRQSRHTTAADLDALRHRLLQAGVTYEQQLKTEQKAQREWFLETYLSVCGPISEGKLAEFVAFAESSAFAAIPLLRIEAHLYASILTRKRDRRIKPSDTTDIDALSAYAPYMDVVCTDAFMADQMIGMANEYGIQLFHGKTAGLRGLKTSLESFLAGTSPIRRPSITGFVLPPRAGRAESFQFFYQLGVALRAMGVNEYGEIYAFDDGAMPVYEIPQTPGMPVPFYGLQDVTPIELHAGAAEADILKICRQRCRSDHFVLIDKYIELPDSFMLGAAMCADAGLDSIQGYRIFCTYPK